MELFFFKEETAKNIPKNMLWATLNLVETIYSSYNNIQEFYLKENALQNLDSYCLWCCKSQGCILGNWFLKVKH